MTTKNRNKNKSDSAHEKTTVLHFGNPNLPRAYNPQQPKLLRLNGVRVPHAVRERAMDSLMLGLGRRLGDQLFEVDVPWESGVVYVVRFDCGQRVYFTSTPKKVGREVWHPSVAKFNGLRRDLHKRAPIEWHAFVDYLLDGGTSPFPIIIPESFSVDDVERQIQVAIYCKHRELMSDLDDEARVGVERLIDIYTKRAEKALKTRKEA